jgi:uncharacterized membrane protein
VYILSVILLHESLTWEKSIGLLFIICGIILTSRSI